MTASPLWNVAVFSCSHFAERPLTQKASIGIFLTGSCLLQIYAYLQAGYLTRLPSALCRYYGCTCEHYPYGCCQDKHTPAGGPNLEGCICSRMLYGCCPDGATPALGENLRGCHCNTTIHGCCPDQRTPARGPRYEGCTCETMPYGCCPDQVSSFSVKTSTKKNTVHFERALCLWRESGHCNSKKISGKALQIDSRI